jgi:GntR family transcriptional repressor for pyruvate dehydrogenase complex
MSKKLLFSKPVKRQTLAEQMAAAIQELILSGELASGATLPTEPELAEQFGVSRAVVRDATRLLLAQGLVEVRHGAGVFVTPVQNKALGEALLLALRRAGATAWDVEHFEQIIFPEVAALAAVMATDEEIAEIKGGVAAYLEVFSLHQAKWWGKPDVPPAEFERLRAAFRAIMEAIFAATHNQVFQQLARPLLNLRNLREWRDDDLDTPEAIVKVEVHYWRRLVEAIAAREPAQARQIVTRLMQLPPEAIEAMRQTPVGEIPVIPIPVPRSPDMFD